MGDLLGKFPPGVGHPFVKFPPIPHLLGWGLGTYNDKHINKIEIGIVSSVAYSCMIFSKTFQNMTKSNLYIKVLNASFYIEHFLASFLKYLLWVYGQARPFPTPHQQPPLEV